MIGKTNQPDRGFFLWRRGVKLLLFTGLLFCTSNFAHSKGVEELEGYKEAQQFLSDLRPGMAAKRLWVLLAEQVGKLSQEENDQIKILLLEAQVRNEKPDRALTFISRNPGLLEYSAARYWKALALESAGRLDEAESILLELIDNPDFSRKDWARLSWARIQNEKGRQEAAEKLLRSLSGAEDSLIVAHASLDLAEILIAQRKFSDAQKILEKWKQAALSPTMRARIPYLEALANFRRGDFLKAEGKFQESSDLTESEEYREIATFNVALTALYAGDEKTFTQFQDLLLRGNNTELQAELMLEQGLYLASRFVTQAFETLSQFLEKYPDHPRAPDCHLALAELYLNVVPAKPVSARQHLETASMSQLTRSQEEALDYIAVWIEEGDENHSAVIDQALHYLDRWPQSRRAAEIRLKLGDAYYREKDYSQAMTALEQLAENHPDSPLKGPALFSAGKAASLSLQPEQREHALEIWDKLAGIKSDPLALYARHEQGLFHLKRDELDQALSAFNAILSSESPPPLELKLAVLADRGQALFQMATSHQGDQELLLDALQSFDSILSDPGSSPTWRNQAAVRKGRCLERLGRVEEALNTYTDVLQGDRLTEGADSDAPLAQVEWFFRAGLEAVRILQEKKEWKRAVVIAESLANSGSSRAIEAARLADRIRLQHFIWDQAEE